MNESGPVREVGDQCKLSLNRRHGFSRLLAAPYHAVAPEENVIHAEEGRSVDHREVIGQPECLGTELPDGSDGGEGVEESRSGSHQARTGRVRRDPRGRAFPV